MKHIGKTMNGPGEAAALFKAVGAKALLGMLGAAVLYIVFPPLKKDGSFDQREFVLRLAVAGIFSCVFGDMTVQQFMHYLPSLRMDEHEGVAYLLTGAPGWWITRAIAVWMHRREGKDIAEIARDVKDSV